MTGSHPSNTAARLSNLAVGNTEGNYGCTLWQSHTVQLSCTICRCWIRWYIL